MTSSEELLGFSVVGIAIWSLILSAIISGSTKSNKLLNHAKAQTLLLADLAKKAGSDSERVKNIVDEAFK